MNTGLTLISMPYDGRRLFALLPEHADGAVARAIADDRVWRSPEVTLHWFMYVDVENTRVKPRNRAKFWLT